MTLFLLLRDVAAQQVSPPSKPTAVEAASQKYGAAVSMLENGQAPQAASAANTVGAAGPFVAPLGAANALVLGLQAPAKQAKGKKEKQDESVVAERVLPLPSNMQMGVALSQAMLNADPLAQQGPDGHIVYAFGRGTYPVVCARDHVTEIDFEPGEAVDAKNIDMGFGTEAIEAGLRNAGSGPTAFSYVVIKPKLQNLDTTMTVGTSKRVYYFHVVSTDQRYVARIAFTYPEEEAAARKAHEDDEQRRKTEAERLAKLAPPRDIRNWRYTPVFHGKAAKFLEPKSIGDDGSRTYIQLQPKVKKLGLPTIEIRGASGPIPANFHWEDEKLVVDAVFEKGCLLYGVGRQQQSMCFSNEGRNAN
jgi:type IV secretion system protein VirB9